MKDWVLGVVGVLVEFFFGKYLKVVVKFEFVIVVFGFMGDIVWLFEVVEFFLLV